MKIKVLTRNPDNYLRETKRDINKVFRNYDTYLHPFEAEREYMQALNAIKLERVFAKPFMGALSGHSDGIYCMAKHPTTLSWFFSGACDGEIKMWNLNTKSPLHSIPAHNGFVRGICLPNSGNYFLSCGDDKTIKLWSLNNILFQKNIKPQSMIVSEKIIYGCDHHLSNPLFATSGEEVNIWDINRTEPIKTYTSSIDSSNCIKFNPVETDILASAASDRNITLYDVRKPTYIKKITLKLKTNSLCWNPIESWTLTCANEDYNAYTLDVRMLTKPRVMHAGHTQAVLDVDYAPSGKEIVTASFDKTLRIFPVDKGNSREIYHAQRMQRIFCVKWSSDNKYIFSGSDEMNIRIWKATAWEKLGNLKTRERNAFNYNQKLKEKYENHPEISRINRHRHIPKPLYKAKRELLEIKQAQLKKEANVMKYNKNKTKVVDKIVISEE
ncbi:unnamed protein product [Gordionus sp. m RMFG-2023]|uniref:DDB1- and CUL4-associated factor 13-like n=1 Tax=Gordionus sp. m RMFG-2023 TaxID=3053472 RepID=UPI0030DFBC4E